MSGYITYIEYVAGTTKGSTENGDLFNNPFKLGGVDPAYTSDRVVEALTAGTGAQTLAWAPLMHGAFDIVDLDPTGSHNWVEVATIGQIAFNALSETVKATRTTADIKIINGSTVAYKYFKDADKKIYNEAAYTNQYTVVSGDKGAYVYNNVVVPQNNLPTLRAEMKSIALVAKARRIAVYFKHIKKEA